jgi:hypothetical protein
MACCTAWHKRGCSAANYAVNSCSGEYYTAFVRKTTSAVEPGQRSSQPLPSPLLHPDPDPSMGLKVSNLEGGQWVGVFTDFQSIY